jgi:hypothetical protein
MSNDDPLQQNIRRTATHHALKQVSVLVDKANAEDASKANVLRWITRYGWLVLLLTAVLVARVLGVI